MLKEEAKELVPVIKAFAEGKTVQFRIKGESEWYDINSEGNADFNPEKNDYRIKPKSKYRPFKYSDECWEEMLKHKPFGWIRDSQISHVISSVSFRHIRFNNGAVNSFEEAFNNYRFVDGTPFGIKEE